MSSQSFTTPIPPPHPCPPLLHFNGNISRSNSLSIALQVAAEVAAPLAKTDQIVIVGDASSGVTGEVSKLVSQLPPAVQALTGVDLSGVSVL